MLALRTGTPYRKQLWDTMPSPAYLLMAYRATTGIKDAGKGHNGGLWEWTSTVFDNHEGFVQSKLYPGYAYFAKPLTE